MFLGQSSHGIYGRLHCGVCLEEQIRHVERIQMKFNLAPSEYCVSVTDALKIFVFTCATVA